MNDLRTAAQQALEAWDTRAGIDTASRAFEALRAALAQQDEPVAWLAPDGSVRETPAAKSFGEWVWGPDDFRPLYTAPPQRKPLTEEEIYRATGHCGVSKYTAITITRAVERAHGIT